MISNPFSISGLFLCITCLTLLIFILRSSMGLMYRIWALFNISVATWGLASFFMAKNFQFDVALTWIKIGHLGVIFIAIFFFHLVYLMCKLKNRFFLRLVYIQGFVFSFLLITDYFISPKNITILFNQFYYDRAENFVYPMYLAIWLTLIFYGHYKLFIEYLSTTGIKRNQILYFFLGMMVGFSGGLTNFMPVLGLNIYPIGNFTIPLYCIIITYAIIRYRLLDIKVAVTRTSIFVMVYASVLGLPFAIAFWGNDYLMRLLGVNWWIVPLVSSTFLATLGPFIYLYIDKKAQNKLLKEQRSYQNILRNASSGMIRIKDLSRLLNVVVHVITKTVKIKHASVYLLDKETNNFLLQASRGKSGADKNIDYIDTGSPLIWQLSLRKKPIVTEEEVMKLRDEAQNQGVVKFVEQLLRLNAALIVPSFVDDKLTGILILGEKASGKLYSEDDLVVFSVLANQAALAIENAQFYDEVKRTHEQLFQAEKMATIGTMADGLSHQINNRFHALSLISGDALDILKTFDGSNCTDEAKQVFGELKGALERIEANVLQGGEVVKGLLKYSRPGDGGFEFIDFKDVINGSIDMVQYKIKLKEIDLIQNIPSNLPKLHANLVQLQEVFFNLIDNAYDATKERQITLKEDGYRSRIEISANYVNGSVEISVSDNGMGVKDLDRKKLFTPFFTTKATAKKGTGLGLYVIDKIIGAHNGKIAIDSIYKSGTNFTITLPISPRS